MIRVGFTNVPFVDFATRQIFELAEVPVGFLESLSNFTGVTAAELRRHRAAATPAKYESDV